MSTLHKMKKTRKHAKTRSSFKRRISRKRTATKRYKKTKRYRRGGFVTPPRPPKRPLEIPDAPIRRIIYDAQEEENQENPQQPVNLFQGNLNPALDAAYVEAHTTPVRPTNPHPVEPTITPARLVYYDEPVQEEEEWEEQ